MSCETRYAAAMRQREDDRANSPEAVAWRLRDNAIRAEVQAEHDRRWPVLTPDNFIESRDWFTAEVKRRHAEQDG